MIEDAELLRRYAEVRSEPAYAEFVQRHVDFVYACALRRLEGDSHRAQDVTQQVFVAAAQEAGRLARHPVVTGWLYTTTRNVAVQAIRTEARRRVREKEAFAMENDHPRESAVDWDRIRPVLDDALDGLNATDREAVLLRYFEGKSFGEVGARLRLAENTARMRVDRALDKLCAALQRRGVTSTATALGVALAAQPGIAAPTGLAAAATGAAVSVGGGAVAAGLFMGMTKLQVAIAGALVVAGASGYVMQNREVDAVRAELDALPARQGATLTDHDLTTLERSVQALRDQVQARHSETVRLRNEVAALRQRTARAAMAVTAPSSPRVGPVFDLGTLDEKPKPSFQLPPQYPFEMRKYGVRGEALLDFVVNGDGRVDEVRVLRSTNPAFGVAAVDAVKEWQFHPGKKNGAPVAARMQVPIVFTLSVDDGSVPGSPTPPTYPGWF